MATEIITLAPRFCGPPRSGNGGYTAGCLAALLPGPVEVTLRSPPPLESPLQLSREGPSVLLRQGEQLIAEARPCALSLEVPSPVEYEAALRATKNYPGFGAHPYPSCFVCGPERAVDDGLRLFPGAVAARNVAAAPWQPSPALCADDGLVDARFIWAALDCPSWWGHACFAAQELPILLGRLSAEILSRPRADERCVVQGWGLERQGRRILCASALYGEDGRVHAHARATWIEVKA